MKFFHIYLGATLSSYKTFTVSQCFSRDCLARFQHQDISLENNGKLIFFLSIFLNLLPKTTRIINANIKYKYLVLVPDCK